MLNASEAYNLKYILRQSIGVFYIRQDWKRWVFDTIKDYYGSIDYINFVSYSSGNSRIELKDGTVIHFVFANERCRGMRFNKAIIEPEIDPKIVNQIIKPIVTPNSRCVELYFNGDIDYV